MSNGTLRVGQPAPDFELQGQGEEKVRLGDLRGQKVVIAFHPLAFTNVCSRQMLDLELNQEKLEEAGAKAVAINVDQPNAKNAWADAIGVKKTPLLSDYWPHGGVAQKYGIFKEEKGVSGRAVYIVDEEGNLAWQKEYEMGEVPDFDEILEAVKQV